MYVQSVLMIYIVQLLPTKGQRSFRFQSNTLYFQNSHYDAKNHTLHRDNWKRAELKHDLCVLEG
ncbi:hypothetical protein M438DRAFT_122586 [Aureobasidium pullulans EXF-150]|uniref:Uncharacterized protein n=1 Tax=Aureobasidium pullulans EXF-150 TaxID=1043002 RepID=A0A074X396_AURPU|nr:uncharacterized protein M438DRAFT_122586 [Aureobasidium pullulans EXF-150]KEQ79873.1 hypothetical protein M438DRAFT_122586 [Aureobasidium pullulans EXF-150]